MTLLEIMIVLAIVGTLMFLAAGAFRALRGGDLIDSTVELGGVMRRTSQLAAETGALHRVVIDLDARTYRIETCAGGPSAITRDPDDARRIGGPATLEQSEEAKARAIADAKQSMSQLPEGALPTGGDADKADEMLLALAGQLAARRVCTLATSTIDLGGAAQRPLKGEVKIRQVWVQHREDPVSSGLVAIHFFPIGSAEKAIVEVADGSGDDVYSILVHGLTGRVETRDEAIRDPERFLFRDAAGEEIAGRD